MKRIVCLLTVLLLAGCSSKSGIDTAVTEPVITDTNPESGSGEAGNGDARTVSDAVETALTPENTRIGFVGTHTDKDPDPDAREGHFADFEGLARFQDDELTALEVEIQIASVTTSAEKLTTHLKSPDFFDARNYPTAKFVSNKIARNQEGDFLVTGDLTLLETTKEVNFTARVGMVDGALTLAAQFKIDRAEFGMTGVPTVSNVVSMQVAVGPDAARSGNGRDPGGERAEGGAGRRPGGGGRGPGGGRMRPEERFKQWDADGDGKLVGDEIPDRMRDNLADIDADGDEAVTLEEMQAAFARLRERGGGGRGGPGGGRGPGGRGGGRGPGGDGGGDANRPERPE